MLDSTDLICAYIFDGNGGGRKIGWPEVTTWESGQGLIWVHLDYSQAGSLEWLYEKSGLPPEIVDALLAEETRPRAVAKNNGLLVTLRGVNTNPGADPEDMVSIRVWLESNRIITTRRRQLLSVCDLRDAIDGGEGPATPGQFLSSLVERLATRISATVETMEEILEQAEIDVETAETSTFRRQLSELRRQAASIRRYLAPQRDALDRLYRTTIENVITQQENFALHEHADRITRNLEDLEMFRERAVVVQEELINRLAQDQNNRMYLLSIVAALFLPLSFLTGLLGMNVGGLPGLENTNGFWVSVTAMGVVSILMLVYFRHKKWI